MQNFVIFAIIISVINFLIISTNGDCNVCHRDTKTACISNSQYQQCQNNKPYGITYDCNPGQYCSLEGGCSENPDLAECEDCRVCDSTATFACLNTKDFALCLGGTNYTEIQAQCTGNLVCNVNYPEICVESAPTCSILNTPPTTTTSTSSTTTTTTTPSPLENPVAFCTAIAVEGRYPVGTDPSTTCHQYIHCRLIGGAWYGPIYNCPGTNYYDSSKHTCVSTPPSTCSGAVFNLSFRNILLE